MTIRTGRGGDIGERCSTCPGPSFRPVPAAGPSPCRVLFLGAGPGKTEDRTGRAYSGQAGEELDKTYLVAAAMRREDVLVSNSRRCWDGTGRTPAGAACLNCARTHIPQLLDRARPEVVVLMGGSAQSLSDTRVRLETQHGVPFRGALLGGAWEGWVWPMYEPALGMRETSRMTQLSMDFRNLGKWMRGEWSPPTPKAYPHRYELLHGELNGLTQGDRPIAVDTEKDGSSPWSMQWSSTPGCGYMLRADDERGLAKWEAYRREYDPEIILHNAPQDLDTLDRMGVHVTRFRDTLQEAYQLCYLPQGLKSLAYRLLGVEMRSWKEVVWPASVAAVSSWMEDAIGLAESGLQDATVTSLKTGTCEGCGKKGSSAECKVCGGSVLFDRTKYQPGPVEKILRHVLTYTAKTEEEDEPYNPWKAIERMRVEGLRGKKAEEWEWEYLQGELGPIPILSIANADMKDAVEYAVGDADMTGQVAGEMEGLRGGERWRVEEEDVD